MYKKILQLIQRAWHNHVFFWARDETTASETRSCVVIAPHPDDESIGMGATIARKTAAGTPVALIVATDGRYSSVGDEHTFDETIEKRKEELISAATILGIEKSNIFFADEIDTRIYDARLQDTINEIIDQLDFTPEEIMSTSWKDGHQDHQACARIARSVAHNRSMVFRGCPIYWWAEGPSRFHRESYSFTKRQLGKVVDLVRAFSSRGYKVRSGEFSELREKAITAHASQVAHRHTYEPGSPLSDEWLNTFDRKWEYFINE
jgi:LmbE family N-acetylglucosaminyl deacetylase